MYAIPTSPAPDSNGNGNVIHELPPQKANQACASCRKQKRKCSKDLPSCSLCARMLRNCDYSDSNPAPTAEEVFSLRKRLEEVESRLQHDTGRGNPLPPYTSPSSRNLAASDGFQMGPPFPAFAPSQDPPWQGLKNAFPAIAFLDVENFRDGGIVIPKPSLDIPVDVLEILGDGPEVQATINKYFATVHQWMPIFSIKRHTRNLANPLWEAGPDLALLFLCMKLITSSPPDGLDCSQNPIYISAKRFVALLEATGTVSLLMLQANVLITWFEYGQAIYPAAYMSAGWCLRYGNLLGISGSEYAHELLGRPGTWTEKEERIRTWWGVLLVNRVVSIGSHGHIINSQEPKDDAPLPVNDYAWDTGEMSAVIGLLVSSPLDEPAASFPRLCQAYMLLGRVFAHHYGEKFSLESDQFESASTLYTDASNLALKIADEAEVSQDYLNCTSALALTFSTLCTLCEKYSCPHGCKTQGKEAATMQAQALEGLKSVSLSVAVFVERINASTQQVHDLDRISPIIMDAMYSAASNFAWLVRESGDQKHQMALDSIRNCLRKLGQRWRNAAEYVRILEAKEFSFAISSAS